MALFLCLKNDTPFTMPIDRTAFQEITPGNFKTRFTTEDGHQFDVTIYPNASSQGEDAVDFACGYLSQEMKIRRRSAKLIFARYDEIKDAGSLN